MLISFLIVASSGKLKAETEVNGTMEAVYLDKFSATCSENQIYDRFANWTFAPVNFSSSFSCISIASCPFSLGKDPLQVLDKGSISFAPHEDYVGHPSSSYDDVEYGGKILAYCKEPGFIFDPENVTVDGNVVTRIVAECVPDQIDDILPDWRWAPIDPVTNKEVLPHLPLGRPLPKCGKYLLNPRTYWEEYEMLYILKHGYYNQRKE